MLPLGSQFGASCDVHGATQGASRDSLGNEPMLTIGHFVQNQGEAQ